MISKEVFCKALHMIREQEKVNDQFTEALQTVGSGPFVFDGGSIVHEALLMVLKEGVNDQYDYISWWLYEATDDYRVWSEDEKREWCLKEPEALYDFIAEECRQE